ncbi:MAG TPA: CPBP family glutamic-type intramembrane protease [Candidatus Omnitrophota bacterium]|nr:CPBP family glutamic-type intramembrane protease [Candidatus Omnitrophota bacterium]
MKGFIRFLVIFGSILLLSAFLTPLLYDFLPFKFERIFNRLVMIGTLLAIVIFVRIKKETLRRFGLLWEKNSLSLLAMGFLAGILTLLLTSALNIVFNNARFVIPSLSLMDWVSKVSLALATGLLIGVIEEFFFRGFIFRFLQKAFKNRVLIAVLVTCVFYSLIHFIGMKKIFIGPDPDFIDGLKLIGAPFVSLAEWPRFWPEAVGLFLFGFALNTAAYKSGSLYPSIGLHAGCVFFIRLDDLFIKFQGERTMFWGSKLVYDGVIGWVFLMLLACILYRTLRPSSVVAKS